MVVMAAFGLVIAAGCGSEPQVKITGDKTPNLKPKEEGQERKPVPD